MTENDFRLALLVMMSCYTIYAVECLECYDCKNITDTALCATTKTCRPNESCFMERIRSKNGSMFTLGCSPNQQCGTHGGAGTAIVGRTLIERQDDGCHECCSSDLCGSQLCAHLAPTSCIDDESIDCSRMNSLFNICMDIRNAKSVCPRFCGLCNVVDGKWSSWSTWTNCSVTCGNGTQIRTRTCTNPSPAHGGENCHGMSSVIKSCSRELCPVHGGWTDWFPWGSCSVTCDVGLQRRTRNCSNPAPSRFGDHCFGDSIDDRLCLPGACVDGGWSTWSKWSDCSAMSMCGGIKTRSRACSNPVPSPYGKYCEGNTMQISSCDTSFCLSVANDCWDVKRLKPDSRSGLYNITLWKTKDKVQVYCDMDTNGGGWTIFQRRFNGSVDFYRTFKEYEDGFGNKNSEFWLGLKVIQEMTTKGRNELRIDLTAANGSHTYEVFQNFYLSPGSNYTLHIDRGTGTAGDFRGLSHHNGYIFATRDKDTDNGCAKADRGGWWYTFCAHANLNGEYVAPGTISSHFSGEGGIIYRDFQDNLSLKSTVMMFRRMQ